MDSISAGPDRLRRPMRVFVVDGHESTRMAYALYLEHLGHTLIAAASMEEALAGWPAADCDVLLCELRLPDGDGWELLARLQRSRPIYAVAITVLGLASEREKSRLAGFRHHLLKPFQTPELDAILEEAAQELATIEGTKR